MEEMVKRIKCGNGNCYLITNGNDAILIDTCREKYRDKILNACRPYNMRLLVLTHGHIDHIQNAAFLSRELQIPIAMSKEDVCLIEDNMAQSLEADNIMGKLVLSSSIKSFREEKIPSFMPNVFLSDGDTLNRYGISARIIAVPGHTNGSIAIALGETTLFVGDALMNIFYPKVSILYHNKTNVLKSARIISEAHNRMIYFGHGKPVKNKNWV